jgi:ribosomal protein L44E
VPETVNAHPAVFATATAPGFGVVHTQRTTTTGRSIPCRARRNPETCPHGVVMRCIRCHKNDDPALGQPLCKDCYEYAHHVVWNNQTGELWRRTAQHAARLLDRHAKQHGDQGRVRLSYGKVAEYQRRGVVHYHALIRLDGIDPDNPDVVIPPPEWANALVLSHVVRTAIEATGYYTKPHPANPGGWLITWGRQLDIRPLRLRGDRAIDDAAVAGYLAKYATKSTDATGHVSKRITPATIGIYADDTHPGRLIDAAWTLGNAADYERLIRWAHMLGFGGQFFSKSKRYSTTFKALRKVRTDWRRRGHRQRRIDTQLATGRDEDTTIVLNTLTYVGSGWHTTGDALLANTSAAMARERRRAAKDALRAQVS